MARWTLLDPGRRGLSGYQGFFLALTLIVMMAIVLTSKDLTSAVLLIGLITNFLIISSQLTLLGDRHLETAGGRGAGRAELDEDLAAAVMVTPTPGIASFDSGSSTSTSSSSSPDAAPRPHQKPPSPPRGLDAHPSGAAEKFAGGATVAPGARPPAFPKIPATTAISAYPGAIAFGAAGGPVASDEALAWGFVDWGEAARNAVPEGNPYDLDRVANPQAAAPCVDDDAIAMYDGDERTAYQARSRNDPERVWAGILRRKALVGRYVGEELDEAENTQWWGRHEV